MYRNSVDDVAYIMKAIQISPIPPEMSHHTSFEGTTLPGLLFFDFIKSIKVALFTYVPETYYILGSFIA